MAEQTSRDKVRETRLAFRTTPSTKSCADYLDAARIAEDDKGIESDELIDIVVEVTFWLRFDRTMIAPDTPR